MLESSTYAGCVEEATNIVEMLFLMWDTNATNPNNLNAVIAEKVFHRKDICGTILQIVVYFRNIRTLFLLFYLIKLINFVFPHLVFFSQYVVNALENEEIFKYFKLKCPFVNKYIYIYIIILYIIFLLFHAIAFD